MNFEIDKQYLTDVIINKKHCSLSNPDNPTHEDLIKILKGHAYWTSTSSEDHPEFANLRNRLEKMGYIQTQRNWWNGDIVLKPFVLNGVRFKKNEQFPCASAIGATIRYKSKSKIL